MQNTSGDINIVVYGQSLESGQSRPNNRISRCWCVSDLLRHSSILSLILFIVINLNPVSLWGESVEDIESTMLMFVGEDIDVLSIASRREESAWQAPAIAEVISREELRERGISTLSQALSMMPGFYMAEKEWGSLPYLRGISNSVLFLYDTVPLNADTSKSLHQLDHQLSMGPVKRIEIIRGPGSVLWGPDAFAGIVNVVPLTGKDVGGIEAIVSYTDPLDQEEYTINMGGQTGAVDALLSISGKKGDADGTVNLVRFWGNGDGIFLPEERMGARGVSEARYLDVFGRISFKDWVTISGRIGDNKKPYAISRSEEDLTWQETRKIPGGFIKLEAKKDISHASAIRFMSYYNQIRPEFEVVDRTLSQREQSVYGELIYDRSFSAGRGLLTSGISYREKWVDDANVWDSYLPEFLGPENETFFPRVQQKDYNTRLWSTFGQYSHKMGTFDFSFGLRLDKHDSYDDNLSYNTAVVWNPSTEWFLKLLYGTAYRTPFARQILDDTSPDLEKVQNLSAQITWKPSRRGEVSFSTFESKLDDHIFEDPYARLSEPNSQTIFGVEISGRIALTNTFDISTNLTAIDNSGSDETYRLEQYKFVRPDGTEEIVYEDLTYAYDAGPEQIFNIMGTWRPRENISAFVRLNYFSERELIYPRSGGAKSFSGQWVADVSARVKDFIRPDWELSCSVKNLLDQEYTTPGTYTGIGGAPFSLKIELRKSW